MISFRKTKLQYAVLIVFEVIGKAGFFRKRENYENSRNMRLLPIWFSIGLQNQSQIIAPWS